MTYEIFKISNFLVIFIYLIGRFSLIFYEEFTEYYSSRLSFYLQKSLRMFLTSRDVTRIFRKLWSRRKYSNSDYDKCSTLSRSLEFHRWTWTCFKNNNLIILSYTKFVNKRSLDIFILPSPVLTNPVKNVYTGPNNS